MEEVPSSRIRVENDGLVWKVDGLQNILALALSYQGVRLGSYWREDQIVRILHGQIPIELHATLRWLKIPILSERMKIPFQKAVNASPFAFLKAWWRHEGLQPSLRYSPADQDIETLQTVARSFLWEWQGSKDATERMLSAFSGKSLDKPDDRINAVLAAGRVCPSLTWSARFCLQPSKYARRALRRLLVRSDDFPSEKFESALTDLREECAIRTILKVTELQYLAEKMLATLKAKTRMDPQTDSRVRRIAETSIGRDFLVASIALYLTKNGT